MFITEFNLVYCIFDLLIPLIVKLLEPGKIESIFFKLPLDFNLNIDLEAVWRLDNLPAASNFTPVIDLFLVIFNIVFSNNFFFLITMYLLNILYNNVLIGSSNFSYDILKDFLLINVNSCFLLLALIVLYSNNLFILLLFSAYL